MNSSPILENRLFVGSCPRREADLDQLQAMGITAVLNLQTDDDLSDQDIRWHVLERQYRHRGLRVRRVPVEDRGSSVLREKLGECVQVLGELIEGGNTVYLHCTAGLNRAPTVAIAYLHWVENRGLRDAADYVQQCRPCAPYMQEIARATRENGQASRRFPRKRPTDVPKGVTDLG